MFDFLPLETLKNYSFVVIITQNDRGEFLLSRKKGFNTWEFQGGHIENDETPYKAALRELREEAGIENAIVTLLVDYYTYERDTHSKPTIMLNLPYDRPHGHPTMEAEGFHSNQLGVKRCGKIFKAKINIDKTMFYSKREMEEAKFFKKLPSNMTYPQMAKGIEKILVTQDMGWE